MIDNHGVFVETSDNLDIKKVSIKWISYKGEKFIFRNGRRVNRLGYVGGEYAFQVYYNDSLIKEAGHIKNKWDNTNDYYFQISKKDKITSTFTVIGPDSISQLYWHEVLHTTPRNSPSILDKNFSVSNLKDFNHHNIIYLTLEPKYYKRIEANENSKFSIKNATIAINNTPIKLKKIKIAGASTLKYRRKSFKISLNEPFTFNEADSIVPIENFRLVSLSMDPYYSNMFISYNLMKEIGVFDLYFSYVELKINNQTQGIYLLIEEPEHYALKRNKSDFILRRDYRHSSFKLEEQQEIEYKSNHKNDSLANNHYLQSFQSIYSSINTYKGKELYESLNKHFNLDLYMKWMAINYFLCNGDYTDEIYFYSKDNHKIVNFDIIPWDYDDILRKPPHEGWDYRHSMIGNKLIYSIEDSLDLKIANDDYLYSHYLKNLYMLAKEIDDQTLEKIFQRTYHELTPLLKKKKIISMSKYDKTKINNYEEFVANLNASYLFLTERRKNIYEQLVQQGIAQD